jgi:hypothetical protein
MENLETKMDDLKTKISQLSLDRKVNIILITIVLILIPYIGINHKTTREVALEKAEYTVSVKYPNDNFVLYCDKKVIDGTSECNGITDELSTIKMECYVGMFSKKRCIIENSDKGLRQK